VKRALEMNLFKDPFVVRFGQILGSPCIYSRSAAYSKISIFHVPQDCWNSLGALGFVI